MLTECSPSLQLVLVRSQPEWLQCEEVTEQVRVLVRVGNSESNHSAPRGHEGFFRSQPGPSSISGHR
ncbi:Metacaspase-1B [Fusarium oxysporum f. sp. albedinis]|nr:Metacaspase-1B [Fusarium oxysporum f. sp. albedinis]